MANASPLFTRQGALAGARCMVPLAASVFVYGTVFGVLAGQTELSLAEALLMSGLVFAGSSQFVALELWVSPLPVALLIVTTLVVNARHVLMGAALQPWFAGLSPLRTYGSLFFLTDENWAVTMAEYRRGQRDTAFLLGGGLVLSVVWISATGVGYLLGGAQVDPAAWGLDFVFSAVFVALLIGLYRGRHELLPWLVAAAVAVIAERLVSGNWYILLGGLAGTLVGAVRHGD